MGCFEIKRFHNTTKKKYMTNTNTDFNTQIIPQENVVQHCEVITQSL